MRGCADGVDGAAVDEKVEVGAVGAVRVVADSADLLARLPPAALAADHVLVEGSFSRARADAADRVDIRTPSPAAMPRLAARLDAARPAGRACNGKGEEGSGVALFYESDTVHLEVERTEPARLA